MRGEGNWRSSKTKVASQGGQGVRETSLGEESGDNGSRPRGGLATPGNTESWLQREEAHAQGLGAIY